MSLFQVSEHRHFRFTLIGPEFPYRHVHSSKHLDKFGQCHGAASMHAFVPVLKAYAPYDLRPTAKNGVPHGHGHSIIRRVPRLPEDL